jgi:hypothetical protein
VDQRVSRGAKARTRQPEANMGKVGRFVTDPKVGAYCKISLDSGEKILVSHDKGGFTEGAVTIEEVRWWGLIPGDTLFRCELGRDEGRRMLARLTRTTPATGTGATPLGAIVDYVKDARSVSEVKAKCAALVSPASDPAA